MTRSNTGVPLLNHSTKLCHNCRRKRLRCDRSRPGCNKCSSRGEQCLGYEPMLRWAAPNAVAIRGKLEGQQVHVKPHLQHSKASQDLLGKAVHYECAVPSMIDNVSVKFSLVDPLLQDLGHRHRLYINHFATTVCQDLVSFDQNNHINPFRSALTLLGEYDFLREIILATGAVHVATLRRSRNDPASHALSDALAARGRAYRLLRHALDHLGAAPQRAVVMIAVVFFINFDLIDSGHGSWMPHVAAAGKLVASIQDVQADIPPFIARLADLVVADSLTYHILGSALAGAEDVAIGAFEAVDIPATLQKAAVYSYHCCPPFVLGLLARACRLGVTDVQEAEALVIWLRGFDVAAWVHSLEGLLSSYDDLAVRISVASAHRAAACLYVVLVVPGVSMRLGEDCEPDALTREALGHLSAVPIEHALAKGIVWPTFLAGAQADDEVSRKWCLQRMQRIWFSTPWICPWGYIESAIIMLQDVWRARDEKAKSEEFDGLNWLQELRGIKKHCLIV